jgi:hypothetical protein
LKCSQEILQGWFDGVFVGGLGQVARSESATAGNAEIPRSLFHEPLSRAPPFPEGGPAG